MNTALLEHQWNVPDDSTLDKQDYLKFLETSYNLMHRYPQYFSSTDGMEVLELAHLLPQVPETILAIYIGINDAVCIFIDPEAFNQPVNKSREYLKKAIQKGEKHVSEFRIPDALSGETEGLTPVILEKGEKLFVARPDFQPCDHCWSNLHADNKQWAVVNENSAVPLNLVVAKPPVPEPYTGELIPPAGSADSTTDWFLRGASLLRTPIKQGHING